MLLADQASICLRFACSASLFAAQSTHPCLSPQLTVSNFFLVIWFGPAQPPNLHVFQSNLKSTSVCRNVENSRLLSLLMCLLQPRFSNERQSNSLMKIDCFDLNFDNFHTLALTRPNKQSRQHPALKRKEKSKTEPCKCSRLHGHPTPPA